MVGSLGPSNILKRQKSTQRQCILRRELLPKLVQHESILSPEEVALSQELIAKLSNKQQEQLQTMDKEERKIGGVQHKKVWKESLVNQNSVEAWIKKLQSGSVKENDGGAFIYLRQVDKSNPYNLVYCNYGDVEKTNGRFYTLSKKGFTSYVKNEAVEFLTIMEWITERESFEQIKGLSFFKLFRLWRAIKYWQHNVLFCSRKTIKDSLERKLVHTKKGMAKILIRHMANCKKLESKCLINVTEPNDPCTLKEFQVMQKNYMEEMARRIAGVSETAKESLLAKIDKALNKLKLRFREEQREIEKEQEVAQRQAVRRFMGLMAPPIEKPEQKIIESDNIYEQLGFQPNLPYSNRAELKKKCKMFIRFSYLLDCIAKTSLKNMYINSLKALDRFLTIHNDLELPLELPILMNGPEFIAQKNGRTIITVQVDVKSTEIPEDEIKYAIVDEYKKPPIGNINEKSFDPTCHLQVYDSVQTSNSDDLSIHRKVKSAYIPYLEKKWLKISPEIAEIAKLLRHLVSKMLEVLKSYERHNKSKWLSPYKSILEDWDEKNTSKREVTESKYLSCEDILEKEQVFLNREMMLEGHIRKMEDNIDNYLSLLRQCLLEYWRYSRIPWSHVTNNTLKHPVDVLTLFVGQIKYHKEKFERNIPSKADLGLCRFNMRKLREGMCNAPLQALKKLDNIMVSIRNKH